MFRRRLQESRGPQREPLAWRDDSRGCRRRLSTAPVFPTIGVIAVGIYVINGILGALAGFYRGDDHIQRLIEIVASIPALIIILVLVAFLEPSIFHIMLVIGLSDGQCPAGVDHRPWPDFVTSAVALGSPTSSYLPSLLRCDGSGVGRGNIRCRRCHPP